MLTPKIQRWFAPPTFVGDEEKSRAAAFLNVLLWASLATQFLAPLIYSGQFGRGALFVSAWTAMIVTALWLLRRGSVRAASVLAVVFSWALVNFIVATSGGVRAPGFSANLIVAGCAGMLLGWRAMVATAAASIAAGLAMLVLEDRGIIDPNAARLSLFSEWLSYAMIFFIATLQLCLFVANIQESLARVRKELAERKRAETALQESEERYRTLVEHAPEAIVVMDDETRKFVDANAQAERLFGMSREELFQRGPRDFAPPRQPDGRESLELARTYVEEALAGGTPSFESVMRDKDGREIFCEVRLARIPSANRRLVRGMIIDVTARKRLEAHLMQAQKMESVGLLAGGVAHDFNNLMAVILSSAELMEMRPECAPAKAHVADIRNAALRATQLTRQLLAFSRKQILQPAVLDLNAVIIETEKMLRRLIGAHIVMRLNLDPQAYAIKVDRVQIEQVILNLAVNARDAMSDPATIAATGGTLTIATRNVSKDCGGAPDAPAHCEQCLVLEVSDTGCGMDEATKARLFEPFFTTKDIGQGTGLGLSTVHGIVKQSGGHITVDSQKGKGASFRIYFPRCEQESPGAAAPAAEETPASGAETILLAEDNDLALGVAARALEAFGYKVLKAESPETAIALARTYEGAIDLLLTDVIMPKMNGRELAREIKLRRPEIRLLFTSGYTRDVVTQQGVLDEGIDLIEKPYTPESLARRVRSVLDAETASTKHDARNPK